jgi:hypothetical protein
VCIDNERTQKTKKDKKRGKAHKEGFTERGTGRMASQRKGSSEVVPMPAPVLGLLQLRLRLRLRPAFVRVLQTKRRRKQMVVALAVLC